MPTAFLWLVFTAVALLTAPVSAQTVRYVAPDGTVVVTNVPNTAPRVDPAPQVPVAPRYTAEIRAAASRWGLAEELVAAVIRVESNFQSGAISPRGARGLMQLMPETATLLGVRNVFDPWENVEGGVRHLRGLLDRFANSLPLALAAYHAGEQSVLLHRGIPPFQDTQAYVARVLGLLGRAGTPTDSFVASASLYRVVLADGTMVYSNLPASTGHREIRR